MKVLKVKSRNYKGKQYYKYGVNIPKKLIQQSTFKEGDELIAEAKKGEIKTKEKIISLKLHNY